MPNNEKWISSEVINYLNSVYLTNLGRTNGIGSCFYYITVSINPLLDNVMSLQEYMKHHFKRNMKQNHSHIIDNMEKHVILS